jgi:RimJ/RimL family protein N-acetyltransferase
MAPETIHSERLIGEVPGPQHVAGLAEILSDDAVAATLWPGELGGARTLEQTAEIVDGDGAHWAVHGFGPWVWRERTSGAVVARGGLERTVVEGQDAVEVLYALRSTHWGRGLATEIARESVRVAFRDLGLDELVAYTLPHNHASRRVMERAGFVFERDIQHAGLPHVLYRLRRG